MPRVATNKFSSELTPVTLERLAFEPSKRDASIYSRLAESFLSELYEQNQTTPSSSFPANALPEAWNSYFHRTFLPSYRQLLLEYRTAEIPGASLAFHPSILYLPLYTQRQVVAQLENLDEGVFLELAVARPGLVLCYAELAVLEKSQPNRYYSLPTRLLARLLAELSPQEAMRTLLSSIKSPYRDFYDMVAYYEQCEGILGNEGALIATYNIAHTISVYHIAEQQLDPLVTPEGDLLPSAYSLPVLTSLYQHWVKEQSEHFFLSLPARLLKELAILDGDKQKLMRRAMGKALLKDSSFIWQMPIEFPFLQTSEALQQRYFGLQDAAPEERAELLAELINRLDSDESDTRFEIASLRALSRELKENEAQGSRAKLLEELAAVEADLTAAQRRYIKHVELKRSVERELEPLAAHVLSYRQAAIRPASELSYPGLPSDTLKELLTIADRALSSAMRQQQPPWEALPLADPIGAGHITLPKHRGRKARRFEELRRSLPYRRLRAEIPRMDALSDVLDIDQALKAGASPDSLGKKFSPRIVEIVRIRNGLWDGGISPEELPEHFPRSKVMVNLVLAREALDTRLALHCELLEHCFASAIESIAERLDPLPAVARRTLLGKLFISLWGHHLAHVPNPYARQLNGYDTEITEEQWHQLSREKSFSAWFERELAFALEEHLPGLYLYLLQEKPSTAYFPHELRELNWQRSPVRSEYTRSLAAIFIDIAAATPEPKLLDSFHTFCNSLGSPFRQFKEAPDFDINRFAGELFNLTTVQRRMLAGAETRLLVEAWAEENERLWYGTEERCGRLSVYLCEALGEHAPELQATLWRQMAAQDAHILRSERETLKAKERHSNGFVRATTEEQVNLNDIQVAFYDALSSSTYSSDSQQSYFVALEGLS